MLVFTWLGKHVTSVRQARCMTLQPEAVKVDRTAQNRTKFITWGCAFVMQATSGSAAIAARVPLAQFTTKRHTTARQSVAKIKFTILLPKLANVTNPPVTTKSTDFVSFVPREPPTTKPP